MDNSFSCFSPPGPGIANHPFLFLNFFFLPLCFFLFFFHTAVQIAKVESLIGNSDYLDVVKRKDSFLQMIYHLSLEFSTYFLFFFAEFQGQRSFRIIPSLLPHRPFLPHMQRTIEVKIGARTT